MRRATFGASILAAAVLAGVGSATAEYRTLSDKTLAGWRIQSMEDTVDGRPKWCLITTPPRDGTTVGVAIGQKLPLSTGKTLASLSLYNGTWDLGPNSAGTVSFDIPDTPRSFTFRRISGNQMQSNLDTDDPTIMKWVETLFSNNLAMSVRLPNDESFTVAAISGEASSAAEACLDPIVSATPPPPRDPFAQPSGGGGRDPFGK